MRALMPFLYASTSVGERVGALRRRNVSVATPRSCRNASTADSAMLSDADSEPDPRPGNRGKEGRTRAGGQVNAHSHAIL